MYINATAAATYAVQAYAYESNDLPSFPSLNLTFPNTLLTAAAVAYLRATTAPSTVAHCVRSAYLALLLLAKGAVDHEALLGPASVELVLVAVLLHDLGWATHNQAVLVSADKRFEVDGANGARRFFHCLSSSAYHHHHHHHTNDSDWWQQQAEDDDDDCADVRAAAGGATHLHDYDAHAVQLVWDAIALHTTASLAQHKEPEVALANSGIWADFYGPHFSVHPFPAEPGPDSNLITPEEFRTLLRAFPRQGFADSMVGIFGGFCRDKPATTFDNGVGEFGKRLGYDGHGAGKEEYGRLWEENNVVDAFLGALRDTVPYE